MAFPAAVLGLVIVSKYSDALLPGSEWGSRLGTGMLFGALLAAGSLSAALRIFVGAWDLTVFLLLIVAGIATIPLTGAIQSLLWPHLRDSYAVLFILGEGSFAALSGYWLLRAERRTGPKAVSLPQVGATDL
jgi:hypothetical protein